MIGPQKEVLHQAPSNNGLLLVVTINLTLEIAGGRPTVLIPVPPLSMCILLRFGFDRLRIVLNRQLPLLLHPLQQILVQSLVILLYPYHVNPLLHPMQRILLQQLHVPLVSLIVHAHMVLLLLLCPFFIFILLPLQQFLLQLGLLALLNLHELVNADLFLGVLKPLTVLFELKCVLKHQLVPGVVHLRVQEGAYALVLVALQNVLEWEVARCVGPVVEGIIAATVSVLGHEGEPC